jgi:nicotinate dehydrogenase subunit B
MQNTHANEAFLDECAAEAGAGPAEVRLRLPPREEARGREVLERVARPPNRQARPGPQRDRAGEVLRGRAVSYRRYELVRTYVAGVAEVEANRRTGGIRVTRFFCFHDCARVVHPDGVRRRSGAASSTA